MKSRSSRLTLIGSRAWGRWPDPSRTASVPFASSASRAPDSQGRTWSSPPWITRIGTRDPRQDRSHGGLVLEPGCQLRRDQRRCIRLEPPSDGVLVRLRGVRLGQALREEELEEVLVLLDPVVAVVLPPTVVRLAWLLERLGRPRPRHRRRQRESRSDERDLLDPLGMIGREDERPLGPPRQRDEDCALGAGRVQHSERIRGELVLPVRIRVCRPVRAAVAASVEGDDPREAGEVGDLQLPVTRVDDRPRRHEQDGRLAGAVDLVEAPHAITLDEARLVRIARARLLGDMSGAPLGRQSDPVVSRVDRGHPPTATAH